MSVKITTTPHRGWGIMITSNKDYDDDNGDNDVDGDDQEEEEETATINDLSHGGTMKLRLANTEPLPGLRAPSRRDPAPEYPCPTPETQPLSVP